MQPSTSKYFHVVTRSGETSDAASTFVHVLTKHGSKYGQSYSNHLEGVIEPYFEFAPNRKIDVFVPICQFSQIRAGNPKSGEIGR